MSELAKKFFSADLSPSEEHALEAELEAFPESAEAFAEAALAHYAALSLPEPDWSRRRALPFRKGLWPLAGLLGIALLCAAWPQGRREPWYEEGRAEFSLAGPAPKRRADLARPRAQLASRREAPANRPLAAQEPRVSPPSRLRRGDWIGVLVRQREEGPAEVWVEDGGGRRVTTLFDGVLPAGERRFEWNGRRGNGAKAGPGSYEIVVKRPGGEKRKQVRLKIRGD